jgi:hypothetical protein
MSHGALSGKLYHWEMTSLAILNELETEYLRLGSNLCRNLNEETPLSAFLLLGLQCTSLLKAVLLLLQPSAELSGCAAVERAFLEACQLQTEFRFLDVVTQTKIGDWFKSKGESWKSDKGKLNAFMKAQKGTGFGREYGTFSEAAHPTVVACRHSVAIVTGVRGLHENPQQVSDHLKMRQQNYENLLFRELWNAFSRHRELMEIPIERSNLRLCERFRDDFIKLREQPGKPTKAGTLVR